MSPSSGTESTSGVYEILLRGNLGEGVVRALGARSFEPRRGKTLVVVDVIDQAHLHGILESLRDQGIEIERVNPV
jgi:hypothetical protein